MCRNFARVHGTLRVTPAMEAGIADHVWSIEELVGLLDNRDMRYLKSWLFGSGLVLTIGGFTLTYALKPVVKTWASSGSGASDFGFFAEYSDYSLLPLAVTLGGIAIMAVAVARIRARL
jgi:hypothetical protein